MKRILAKKLTLTKTTVANLNEADLLQVKGGYVTARCGTAPNCTFGCTGPAVSQTTKCCD